MKTKQPLLIKQFGNLNINIVIKKYSTLSTSRQSQLNFRPSLNSSKLNYSTPKQATAKPHSVFSIHRASKNIHIKLNSSSKLNTTRVAKKRPFANGFVNKTTEREMALHMDDVVTDTHSKSTFFKFADYMKKNSVTADIRSKMVDWMVEVLCLFKSSKECWFGAVSILDRYLLHSASEVSNEDVHLIGITSMLISSKLHDVQPIFLSQVVELMGRYKFKPREIKLKELEICTLLNWSMWAPTPFTYLRQYITTIAGKYGPDDVSSERCNEILKIIQEKAERLCMIAMYGSNVITFCSYNLIASACLIHALSLPCTVIYPLSFKRFLVKLLSGENGTFYPIICSCISEIKIAQSFIVDLKLTNLTKFQFESNGK